MESAHVIPITTWLRTIKHAFLTTALSIMAAATIYVPQMVKRCCTIFNLIILRFAQAGFAVAARITICRPTERHAFIIIVSTTMVAAAKYAPLIVREIVRCLL